jgi:hypothetical protein
MTVSLFLAVPLFNNVPEACPVDLMIAQQFPIEDDAEDRLWSGRILRFAARLQDLEHRFRIKFLHGFSSMAQ